MGEVIEAARPYFWWATQLHRAVTPERRQEVRRNQLTALHATTTSPHIKQRLSLLLSPNPEGSSIANA